MTAPYAIEVEGAKELRKIFRDLGDKDLGRQLRDANRAVADMVVEAAVPEVPVRSGRLRDSVKGRATQTTAYGKAGSARVPYAAAIHWGTGPRPGTRGPHNITGRPFLWDAADRVVDRAVKEYEDAVQSILDGVRNR